MRQHRFLANSPRNCPGAIDQFELASRLLAMATITKRATSPPAPRELKRVPQVDENERRGSF